MADPGGTVSRAKSFTLCARLISCPCRSVFKVADINKVSKRKASETIQPLFNKYEKPDEWRYVPFCAVCLPDAHLSPYYRLSKLKRATRSSQTF